MRLIDADKMRENLEWCKTQAPTDNFWDDAIERLDVQPTVESVPLEPLCNFLSKATHPCILLAIGCPYDKANCEDCN